MKPNRKNPILLASLSFPLASLLATTSVHAGQIWDGGSSASNNWNTASNWDGTTVNPDGTGVLASFTGNLSFGGNTQTSTNNDVAGASPTTINFTNNGSAGKTSAFTLAGNDITLGGGITTTANTTGSTFTDSISLNMVLTGNRTITTNQLSNTVQHNLSISGNITQDATGGRSLIKAGNGILTLSGTNNYSGATQVNSAGGTLKIDAASALPSGSQINLRKNQSNSGTLLMNTSGVNVYNNTFDNFQSSVTTVAGGPATIQNAQGDNTFTGNMNINAAGGSGVILQSDAGTLRIAGNLTNTVSNSYRQFEFAGAGNSVFSGQANDTSGTIGVALMKSGSGTLSITGTNSNFIGGVTVLQGVLNVASVANTGTNSSIGAGGTINLSGQDTSGTFQYTGSTTVTTDHALNVAATGGTLDASGTGSGTLKFTGAFTSTDPTAFNLNFTNGSNVATNSSSFAPGTVGGNVMTATATGLAGGTNITSISGNSYTLSNLYTGTTGAVSTTFGTVARTLTLTGSNGGANEISSTLANSSGGGVLGINKTGEGAWTLSGANTYSGATMVSAGTLFVTGSLASDVAVNANATLGGGGTVGALSFDGGSYFDIFDAISGNPLDSITIGIGSAGFGIDNLVSQGASVNWGAIADGTYNLITGTLDSLNLDNFGLANAFDIDGISGSRSAYFQNGSLQLVVIPEPHAALLGGLSLLALLRRRRKY